MLAGYRIYFFAATIALLTPCDASAQRNTITTLQILDEYVASKAAADACLDMSIYTKEDDAKFGASILHLFTIVTQEIQERSASEEQTKTVMRRLILRHSLLKQGVTKIANEKGCRSLEICTMLKKYDMHTKLNLLKHDPTIKLREDICESIKEGD